MTTTEHRIVDELVVATPLELALMYASRSRWTVAEIVDSMALLRSHGFDIVRKDGAR